MKNLFRQWGALLMMWMVTATANAAPEKEAEALPLIPDALSKVRYITEARPKEDAKVYFLFHSRSVCGHCVRHTPEIIAQYKRMRGKGAEIVLLNCDANDAVAEKWAESAKMTYPVVVPGDLRKVPFKFDFEAGPPPSLPLMVAVTADGERLGQAGGANAAELLKDWRKMVNDVKKAERKRKADEKKAAAEADKEANADDMEAKSQKSKKSKKKSKKSKRKKAKAKKD